MPKRNEFNKDLILTRVKKSESGCWIWQQSTDSSGYGAVMCAGVYYRTHRLALHLWKGFDLNSLLYVCHHCDIPACCNPDHLFTGTQRDNMRDSARKGRHADFKGSKHGKAKVDEDDVLLLRELHSTGEWSSADLGRVFGTNRGHALDVIKKRIWRHL